MDEDAVERLMQTFRDAPIVKRSGYDYFIHPLSDGIPSISLSLLEDAAEGIASLLPPPSEYDMILTAEAMGIPLATVISLNSGKPFTIARKKSYGLEGEVQVKQRTGYSASSIYINLPDEGKRLIIIDDVLSTGGTFRALNEGVRNAGWEIEAAIILVDKMGGRRKELEEELGFPIWALFELDVVDERCIVRRPDDLKMEVDLDHDVSILKRN